MAAVLPVTACFAFRTLPVAPFPRVRPNCHGPTCVFLFPLFDKRDAADMMEFRAESGCMSVATESRSVSWYLFGVGVIRKDDLSGVLISDSPMTMRDVPSLGDFE